MDERDQKSLTVGDILDQLVKPSVIQGQSTQVQPPKTTQPPSPQNLPSLKPSEAIKLPQLGRKEDNKPSSVEIPGLTSQAPSIQGGLSSSGPRIYIRTMADDLDRIKKGQAISGFQAQAAPIAPRVKEPVNREIPKDQEPENKPSIEDFKKDILEKISLPPLSKSPQDTKPSLPEMPILGGKQSSPQKPIPEGSELRIHNEIQILDKDMLPSFPGAPLPKKVSRPQDEKVEYSVIARVVSSGMTTGILSTISVALLIYLALVFFVFNKDKGAINTPQPIPSGNIDNTQVNELETVFSIMPSTSFNIPQDGKVVVNEFKAFVENDNVTKKEFKKVSFIKAGANNKLSFTQVLDELAIKYPSELKALTNGNNIVLIYGQDENFGELNQNNKRIVFIAEVSDLSAAVQAMMSWELALSENLENLFDFNHSKQASQTFLSNERRGVQIRYKNFPLPDKTIDYAIITSLTGKHYLILTNSRESMYSPTDKIMGI